MIKSLLNQTQGADYFYMPACKHLTDIKLVFIAMPFLCCIWLNLTTNKSRNIFNYFNIIYFYFL